ncbi:MAG: hypothetical protein ACXU89_09390 [Xanthobacteraceae bacterium]
MEPIDKSKWPEGDWTTEPDREIFVTSEGLDAAVLRHPSLGHLCGYVGVPPGHPLHGRAYDEVYDIIDPEVHGGLTYSENGLEDLGENPAAWYFGFDCAHCYDVSPGMLKYGAHPAATYRTFSYVKRQIAALSKQIAAGCAK